MRVALYNLTTTTQFGGVESFVWNVARCLSARGIDTTIVGGAGKVSEDIPGVKIVRFPYMTRARLRSIPGLTRAYTLTKLFERLTFGAGTLPYMRREKFDIVHIQKPYDLPATLLLRSLGAGRVVFGCHGTDFFPGDRSFAPRADISVACSAFNAGQVHDHYGIAPRVVVNGIDPDQCHPMPVDPELRDKLAGDAPLVVYVGRLVRWKGVQYLIQAVAQLAKKRAVRLAIVGTGEYRPALEQCAADLGIGGLVTFVGFAPAQDLLRYYAVGDVVCLPSYANETFGITLLEAMAMERATVAANFGGMPEVMVHGETGLLFRPEDADDLAHQIDGLLDNPARRAQMGKAGRQRALELFTWDKVTDRVLDAYREILPRA